MGIFEKKVNLKEGGDPPYNISVERGKKGECYEDQKGNYSAAVSTHSLPAWGDYGIVSFSAISACSSTGKSTSLLSWWLWVRVPPGAQV